MGRSAGDETVNGGGGGKSMIGLGLLVGHLIGDYILQDDWQATNKTNPHPGELLTSLPNGCGFRVANSFEWNAARKRWMVGHAACTLHCLLYTLAVWACSFWWMPWWGLAVCFAVHWPVDRWRLARVLMRWTNHEQFATGPLAPWSIIVTDNTIHLAVLFAIGIAAGYR